jgi:hypothetical protein
MWRRTNPEREHLKRFDLDVEIFTVNFGLDLIVFEQIAKPRSFET